MASVSLKQILNYLSLTGMIQLNVPSVPRRLPEGFYKASGTKVEGDAGRYTRFSSSRTPMRTSQYYSPSKATDLRPVGQMDVKLLHGFENLTFDGIVLEAMRNFDNYNLQERGKEWVAKQMADARMKVEIAEDLSALFALARGKIWRDTNGNWLPTASGADANQTADFGISSSILDQQIGTVTGISGSWASPATPIHLQLERMRIKAQEDHGYISEIVLYGRNVPQYLAANDHVAHLLGFDDKRRESRMQNKFPEPAYNFLNFEWYPMGDAGFNNASGVYQMPIDPNAIVLMPRPDDTWWEKLEGSYMIPTNINIQGGAGAEALVASLDKVYGRFAYGKVEHDPVRIVSYYGNTWLYVIKNPAVVYPMLCA